MNLIKKFIEGFLGRSGSAMFMASVGAKILSFCASILVLQFVSDEKLGVVLYAYNIILFILPISGIGLTQSLIRFGSLATSKGEKDYIFTYVVKKGTLGSLGMIVVLIAVAYFINFPIPNSYFYLSILSFSILPYFLLESLKSQLRVLHNNKIFALSEVIQNLILLVLVCILSYYLKELGYALALILTPLLTFLFFSGKVQFNLSWKNSKSTIDFGFYKYGFFASLSNVLTQLLFIIDILLLGVLLSDSEIITKYRYLSLIPLSLLFIPRVFMATDFVTLTEKIAQEAYIKNYIKSYLVFFTLLSFIMLLLSYLFSNQILTLFGPSFLDYQDSFLILMAGICGIFMIRGLFGNLLSSIGKAHINYYIALIGVLSNIALNYYLIPKYGIKGAAVTSALLMWFTGILSLIFFVILYRKNLSQLK